MWCVSHSLSLFVKKPNWKNRDASKKKARAQPENTDKKSLLGENMMLRLCSSCSSSSSAHHHHYHHHQSSSLLGVKVAVADGEDVGGSSGRRTRRLSKTSTKTRASSGRGGEEHQRQTRFLAVGPTTTTSRYYLASSSSASSLRAQQQRLGHGGVLRKAIRDNNETTPSSTTTTEKRRKKTKMKTNNASINAIQEFFDVDSNIITTEDEDADQEDEFEKTQLEIWGQLTKCLGKVLLFTFGVPYFASCSLQAMFVDPWLELRHSTTSAGASGSSLTKAQTESVCNDIARFEKRLYYENLARFPDEQDAAKFEKTKRKLVAEEMKRLEEKERTRSTKALGNWIGSMMYVSILACVLVYQKEFVSKMLTELSAQFNGLDSATQAFALMLGADMVVGYHSSDGWQAFLAFMITRYGGDYHKFETFARMFVATVPVFLDVCFKYWVFNKLRKISPSTQIILSEIERH